MKVISGLTLSVILACLAGMLYGWLIDVALPWLVDVLDPYIRAFNTLPGKDPAKAGWSIPAAYWLLRGCLFLGLLVVCIGVGMLSSARVWAAWISAVLVPPATIAALHWSRWLRQQEIPFSRYLEAACHEPVFGTFGFVVANLLLLVTSVTSVAIARDVARPAQPRASSLPVVGPRPTRA